jgi:hypothetical protein
LEPARPQEDPARKDARRGRVERCCAALLTSKITIVFLAEAMVSTDSKTKPRAVQMLKNAIAAPNNPEFVTEEAAAVEDAKALLRKWGA